MFTMNKYIFYLSSLLLTLFSIIAISSFNVHFCKTLSWYRIFTINSTVCKNLTVGEDMLEKTLTSLLLSSGCIILQDIIYYFNLFASSFKFHTQTEKIHVI